MSSPTVDILQGVPVACYGTACYELTEAGWLHYQDTLHAREYHTSAVLEEGLLLVGGYYSPSTTEVLLGNGGQASEGFSLNPGRDTHCSIQVRMTKRNLYFFLCLTFPLYIYVPVCL